MNGCELPVIINSGSGNQGITVSIPVIEYAKEVGTDGEHLLRALALSNLAPCLPTAEQSARERGQEQESLIFVGEPMRRLFIQ